MKRLLFFIAFLCATITTVNAQFHQWVGGNDFLGWGNPNNWEDDSGQPGVPGFLSDVVIDGDVFIFYDPQFITFYNSLEISGGASLSVITPIEISSYFYLEAGSTLDFQLNGLSDPFDAIVNVFNGGYEIEGTIVPIFSLDGLYVPQIGNEIIVATGDDSSYFGGFTTGNAITTDDGVSIFEVAYSIQETIDYTVVISVNDINYTGAKSWDGEVGNGLWSSPANWDPNGVPSPTDYVIINKVSGTNVTSGGVLQKGLLIGENNILSLTGNLQVASTIKINETAILNWSSGSLLKRFSGDLPSRISSRGIININGVSIEDGGFITNKGRGLTDNEFGIIELNGDLNINNGHVTNTDRGIININSDGITIGYTSGPLHRLNNYNDSIIEKTAASGSGASSINLTTFNNSFRSILRCENGTIQIGEDLTMVVDGTLAGSGAISLPSGYVLSEGVSPGSSPGILTFVGDLTTSSTADFNIEIDGTTAGTDYDKIIVTNSATLEGNINVTLGYAPANNASFEILTAATLNSCDFPAQVTANYLGTDYTFDIVCNGTSLFLNAPGVLSTENEEKQEVSIYPNPVSDFININSNNILQGTWKVYNQLGQIVKQGELGELQTRITVKVLNTGLYFVRIDDANSNRTIIRKIIVSK